MGFSIQLIISPKGFEHLILDTPSKEVEEADRFFAAIEPQLLRLEAIAKEWGLLQKKGGAEDRGRQAA